MDWENPPEQLLAAGLPTARSVWSACSLLPLSKTKGAQKRRPHGSYPGRRTSPLSSSGGEGRGEEALLSFHGPLREERLAAQDVDYDKEREHAPRNSLRRSGVFAEAKAKARPAPANRVRTRCALPLPWGLCRPPAHLRRQRPHPDAARRARVPRGCMGLTHAPGKPRGAGS